MRWQEKAPGPRAEIARAPQATKGDAAVRRQGRHSKRTYEGFLATLGMTAGCWTDPTDASGRGAPAKPKADPSRCGARDDSV